MLNQIQTIQYLAKVLSIPEKDFSILLSEIRYSEEIQWKTFDILYMDIIPLTIGNHGQIISEILNSDHIRDIFDCDKKLLPKLYFLDLTPEQLLEYTMIHFS